MLNPSILRILGRAMVIGWITAICMTLWQMSARIQPSGKLYGGDFITFVAAGRTIVDGNGEQLYDLGSQRAAQHALSHRNDAKSFLPFVNPPLLAIAWAPLAILPYRLAYLASVLASVAALIAGLRALKPHLPRLSDSWDVTILLIATFLPVAMAITSSQNTTFSFALLAWTYAALCRRADRVAGLGVGLLFFKPHFALILCILLAWNKKWATLLVAGGAAIVHYLIGAAFCGIDWPFAMLRCIRDYLPLEVQANGAQSISLWGFCSYSLPTSIAVPIAVVLIGGASLILFRCTRAIRFGDQASGVQWGLIVTGIVMLSPHTQWYDAGLLVIPALFLLDRHLAKPPTAATQGMLRQERSSRRSARNTRSNLRASTRAGAPTDLASAAPRTPLLLRIAFVIGFLLPITHQLATGLGWQPMIALPMALLLLLAANSHAPAESTHESCLQ